MKLVPFEQIAWHIATSNTWNDMRNWTKEDWYYFKQYMAHNGITGHNARKVIWKLKKLSKRVIDP